MIPHPDWRALCLAVGERPDDDLPRLVAADWLDEHGQPDRAAFIRLQIEYERVAAQPRPPACYCRKKRCEACARVRTYEDHRSALYDRFHVLEVAHAADWCGFALRPGWRVGRRRGFVESVTLPPGEFLRSAEELFRAEPLTWVSLERVTPLRPEVPPGETRIGDEDWRPRWLWSRGEPAGGRHALRGPHVLPGELFGCLPGAAPGAEHLEYPDWRAARNALNAGCVGFGRRRAGLPAWVPPKL